MKATGQQELGSATVTKEVAKVVAKLHKESRSAKRAQLRQTVMSIKAADDAVFSRQDDSDNDLFEDLYGSHSLLAPPFNFDSLWRIYGESDVLQECIDAMAQNIDGFGWQPLFVGDDVKEKKLKEAVAQQVRMESFFTYANDEQSFTSIRKLMRVDLEVLGNGAFEAVRSNNGMLQMLYWLPFQKIRISALDGRAQIVTVHLMRDGELVPIKVKKYFRKYAVINPTTGYKLRWFKSFGDPRTMDALTGEFTTAPKMEASELIHFKLPWGKSVYGYPRWIGPILDVMGRRQAQYVNYDLFQSQGIPPMAILVSGGVLTDESYEELETLIRSMRGVEKWNKILILESNLESVGMDEKGSSRIELKNLSEYRKEDAMFAKYLSMCEETIRHRFRLPPLYTGMSETFCVSSDTETLTENGWKFFWEVEKGEKIATLNPNSDCLEYHAPKNGKPYVFEHDGLMCHFENTAVNALVTPNHRMYLSKRIGASWEKVNAESIFRDKGFNYRVLFKMAPVSYEAPDVEKFELPVFQRRTDNVKEVIKIPMDDILTFTGLYLGDGCPSNIEERKSHNITLGAKKERKLKIFREIGERFDAFGGISCSSCEKADGNEVITISGRGLREWVVDNCGRGAHHKRVPEKFMRLNSRQSELILEGLVATDGNVCTGRKHDSLRLPDACRFATTSLTLVHQTQLLAFKCGFRTAISEYYKSSPNAHDLYYVNMVRKGTIPVHNFQYEQVPYKGPVYCFEVPNHLFVTRRKGKIGIHGNTHATAKAAQTVAEEQVFIPERKGFDEEINRKIVGPELGVYKWLFKTKGPQAVGAEVIAKNLRTFQHAGAVTVNHAIDLANRAFGLEMSKYDDEWASYPIEMVLELIKTGRLKGIEAIDEGAPESASGALPSKQKLTLVKGQQPFNLPVKVFKSDMFSPEEKALYKKLLLIQNAVESTTPLEEEEIVL